MNDYKELIEKIKDLEGSIEAFRALLTLELGWNNQQIRAYLRVIEEHLNFLRVIQ